MNGCRIGARLDDVLEERDSALAQQRVALERWNLQITRAETAEAALTQAQAQIKVADNYITELQETRKTAQAQKSALMAAIEPFAENYDKDAGEYDQATLHSRYFEAAPRVYEQVKEKI